MSNSKKNTHPQLPPAVVDLMLDLLSTDDAFRAKFKDNPAQALAAIGAPGVTTDSPAPVEGDAFYCLTAVELAPKEVIARSRAELRSYLVERTNHTVIFAFDADAARREARLVR